MAKVELKQPIVQAIVDDITGAESVVLVDYRGLTVAQDTELRKQLREAGIIYKVCKNTMMRWIRSFFHRYLAVLVGGEVHFIEHDRRAPGVGDRLFSVFHYV